MNNLNRPNLLITHIINPVDIGKSSDLHLAQPITFKSLKNAVEYTYENSNDIEVTIKACCYKEDENFTLHHFKKPIILERSAQDINTDLHLKKLPFILDILSFLAASNSNFDDSGVQRICIYTNVDIAVQRNFYVEIASIFRHGYDCFTINRRTISNHYSGPEQLDEMYGEKGSPHPGHDRKHK